MDSDADAAAPPPPLGPPEWNAGADLPPSDARPVIAPTQGFSIRLGAFLQVLACSGFPTQFLLSGLLAVVGLTPFDAGSHLNPTYVFVITVADTVLVIALVIWFLHLHGESPREVLLGSRAVLREALLGILQIPVVFLLAAVVLGLVQYFAPVMHDVARNPMERLVTSPSGAWLFAGVAVLGGGVREEIQRGFVLHRFRQYLGGGWVGLVVFSLTFGLGHVLQGRDVAITTAALGAYWGLVYLRRSSIVASVTSHSGFNAAEIFRYTFYGV